MPIVEGRELRKRRKLCKKRGRWPCVYVCLLFTVLLKLPQLGAAAHPVTLHSDDSKLDPEALSVPFKHKRWKLLSEEEPIALEVNNDSDGIRCDGLDNKDGANVRPGRLLQMQQEQQEQEDGLPIPPINGPAWPLLSQPTTVVPDIEVDSTVLVSVIDGSLHALDARSGRLLWAFSSGKPLVSASGPQARPPSGQQPQEPQRDDGNTSVGHGVGGKVGGDDGADWEEEEDDPLPSGVDDGDRRDGAIIPGPDGSLYEYTAGGIRRLPVTVQQFVESSPSVTRDGVVVLGSKTSTVFLVDASTGALLREFDATEALPDGGPEEEEEVDASCHISGPQQQQQQGSELSADALGANSTSDEVCGPLEPALASPENGLLPGGIQEAGGFSAPVPSPLEVAQRRPCPGARPSRGPLLVRRTDYTVRALEIATGRMRWNVTVSELSTLHHPSAQRQEDGVAAGAPFFVPSSRVPFRRIRDGPVGPLVAGHDNSLRLLDPASGVEAWQVAFPAAPVAVYTRAGVLVQELVSQAGDGVIYLSSIGGQPFALPLSPLSPSPARGGSLPLAALPGAGATRSTKVTRIEAPWLPARPGGGVLVPVIASERVLYDYSCAMPEEKASFSEIVQAQPLHDQPLWKQLPPAPGPQSSPVPPSPLPSILSVALTAGGVALLILAGILLALALSRRAVRTRATAAVIAEETNQAGAGKKKKGRRGGLVAAASAGGGTRSPASLSHLQTSADVGPQIGPKTGRSSSLQGSERARREEGGAAPGGRWIGRLFVMETVIGYGSHGTTVLEGELEGRRVAVKRLLAQFYDKARQEIAALIASDEHPNVVRCFAMEEDAAFVYVALERCDFSLADLVQAYSANFGCAPERPELAATAAAVERARREGGPERLWDEHKRPTEALLQVCRDVIAGLAHLHELGIVHRDLKPQNVLICVTKPPGRRGGCALQLRAKLSDMGISKRLEADASSFDPHTGLGSSGWQAPEQMQHARQTRAVDMFALGCLLFYAFSGGQHPFGDRYERDANILRGNEDLFAIEHLPEAVHVVQSLLSLRPPERLPSAAVQLHPVLWDAEKRLSFLKDASDRVEGEDRLDESALLAAMEAAGPSALGGPWDEKLDGALLGNLGQYRRYNFRSVRDLLRVIRNKSNHYRELPQNIQALLGPIPDGYEIYFRRRFPRLLLEVYTVLHGPCLHDEIFSRYFYKPATP